MVAGYPSGRPARPPGGVELRLRQRPRLAREPIPGDGLSPADLRSLAQAAALVAMARDGEGTPAVTHEDFVEALGRLRSGTEAAVA